MPAPRVPTEVLALRGGLKAPSVAHRRFIDPTQSQTQKGKFSAIQQALARPELPPAPPPHLKPDAQACWKEILDHACLGTLKVSDWMVVEQLAVLVARMRKNNWDCPPHVFSALNRCLAVLGLTPADRSRIAVAKDDGSDQSRFSKFKASRAA